MSMLSLEDQRPTIRELEVLDALMTERKTTTAAERTGLSQPTVSRTLGQLEARLGRELFVRDGGRLVPNADAFTLHAEAQPVLQALNRMIEWPKRARASALRILAPPTIAHAFISPLLFDFARADPDVRLQVEVGRSTDAVNAVADGSADLGVVDVPVAHAGVRSELFRRSDAQVLAPRDHRLAALDVVSPREIGDDPLIVVTRRFSARAQIESAFAAAGITPRIVLEAGTLQLLAEMVREGLGVAVINPFPISAVLESNLVFRPFTPSIPYETAFLLPAATEPPAARRFIDFARERHGSDHLALRPGGVRIMR